MSQNELFNLDNYSAPVPAKNKKKYSGYRSDPAWDDGSAFPETSSTRVVNESIILLTKESVNNDSSVDLTASICDDGTDSDRWNPELFNTPDKFQVEASGQVSIFLDSSDEPPEPDDFETLQEFEEAWQLWENLNSLNLTCAQALALATLLQVHCLGLSLSGLLKLTDIAQTSCINGFPTFQTMETSKTSTALTENPMLSPAPRPVSRLVSEVREWQRMTIETVSPHSSDSLRSLNQDTVLSKTCQDLSTVHSDPEYKNSTSTILPNDSEGLGTDWKVLSFPVHCLEVPLLDSDCCWLPSPTAYSSMNSRPAGTNKLEEFLKEKELLKEKQVINPAFLEEIMGIPDDWTSPYQSASVLEYLEEVVSQETDVKRLAMHLIQELQLSQSQEFYISKALDTKAKGCLYKYLENKKRKNGDIVTYPRVDGDRDPDNQNHWRWGFNWEEKVDQEWKNKSIGCVPVRILGMVKAMQKLDTPLFKIIDFIRESKRSN